MASFAPDQVLSEVIDVMKALSGEWEYSGPVTAGTRFFADMELKSLDFAILTSALVNRYGRLPFHEFYTELAERSTDDREVTVAEYSEFVCRVLNRVSAGA